MSATVGHRRERGLIYVGSAPSNPYLRLLYEHLARQGFTSEHCTCLSLPRLAKLRSRSSIVHFHWPEGLYRARRGPTRIRGALSWLKLARLAVRLTVARTILRFRIVWTVHQVAPHERAGQIDVVAARLLARKASLVLVHDVATADAVRAGISRTARVEVVEHGSYVGVYEPRDGREVTRRRLGFDDETIVFLAFGELRGYKDLELLLEAWRRVTGPVALAVAGRPTDTAVAAAVERAARLDPRIRPLLAFVPDGEVADLFAAADVAVVARSDGGTSGALILALSCGIPAVAARRPANEALVRGAAWFFEPSDPRSLANVLSFVARDRAEIASRGNRARQIAADLDWSRIAGRLATLLGAAPSTSALHS